MRLKRILDVVRDILAEYRLAATHGGPVCAHLFGVSFSWNFQFDLWKYIMASTLDAVHPVLQKRCLRLILTILS